MEQVSMEISKESSLTPAASGGGHDGSTLTPAASGTGPDFTSTSARSGVLGGTSSTDGCGKLRRPCPARVGGPHQ